MAFERRRGIVIGIDPDIEKNGVAVLNRNYRSLDVYYLTFPETLELVKKQWEENQPSWDKDKSEEENKRNANMLFMVYVEAGWLNKGNWHVTESRNGKFSPQAWAAAVGKSDGECSAVSKKLIECFEYYGVPVSPIRPLKKCWKGRDRKITHEELLKELQIYKVQHKLKGRSNQEMRDSVLLALVNL